MNIGGYCVLAFLFGSLPTAYLVAKKMKGIDIRQHGSGNVGATNAFRVLGKGPGSFVFAVDFLKGFLPVWLFISNSAPITYEPLIVGAFGILGHIFTPFLNFRGGKGVATGAGVLAASFPVFFLISFLTWVVVFLITKIVSISSVAAVIALSAISWFHAPMAFSTYVLTGLSFFVIWTHRSNIRKLLKGEEKKIG